MTISTDLKLYIKRSVCSRPGAVARLVRHPNPLRRPCRAGTLDLVRNKGLGDVLMCTPALRELKHANPNCYVRFFTDFGPLVEGLPYIDEVAPTQSAPARAFHLRYEGCTPPQGNLARIIGDHLGVNVRDVRPDCVVLEELVERHRISLQAYPKPHVVILRRASAWTPNKDWPHAFWNVVAQKVSRIGTVIEIGGAKGLSPDVHGSYLDWRETTTLQELAALISVADLYIGPVSGPMHIAAAVGTARVVIYGGYEHPIGQEGYELITGREHGSQINLYSSVPCAPCWLLDECPYDRKCLTMIEPDEVMRAVETILDKR